MNIFIMGAPGSGKGTFSTKIKEEFNLNHISTGDIFRANIAGGTELGLQAKAYSEKGLLVPDEITNKMVKDYLNTLEDKKNGYLLDGYPRTLAQAKAFEEMTTNPYHNYMILFRKLILYHTIHVCVVATTKSHITCDHKDKAWLSLILI